MKPYAHRCACCTRQRQRLAPTALRCVRCGSWVCKRCRWGGVAIGKRPVYARGWQHSFWCSTDCRDADQLERAIRRVDAVEGRATPT